MTANHEHTPTTDSVRRAFIDYEAWGQQQMRLRGEAFDRWFAAIEAAAEQRGAEAALMCENEISMEHHEQTDDFPCTRCLTRAQEMIDEYRANQMEGDDENLP